MYYNCTFDDDNFSKMICPIISAAGEGYVLCRTTRCAMWVEHICRGKSKEEGHCGLVHLPVPVNVTVLGNEDGE